MNGQKLKHNDTVTDMMSAGFSPIELLVHPIAMDIVNLQVTRILSGLGDPIRPSTVALDCPEARYLINSS
jgi:hypothetical protein